MKKWYKVRIYFPWGVEMDAIPGLNAEDALMRAQWNWGGEELEIVE